VEPSWITSTGLDRVPPTSAVQVFYRLQESLDLSHGYLITFVSASALFGKCFLIGEPHPSSQTNFITAQHIGEPVLPSLPGEMSGSLYCGFPLTSGRKPWFLCAGVVREVTVVELWLDLFVVIYFTEETIIPQFPFFDTCALQSM
jgi:hypothetical protein